MDSNVGLAIQCVGVLLITLLSNLIRSSIKSNALRYWTASWASLSISLMSLFIGFHLAGKQSIFYTAYFFGEYVFALLFIAGCRNHVRDESLTRRHGYFLIPAIVVSLVLPHVSRDFNDLFMIHAAILSVQRAARCFSASGRPPRSRFTGARPRASERVLWIARASR